MDSLRLNQQARQAPSLKQAQRLMMSDKMQQALHILQMPCMEMQERIDMELEQNPVLEVIEDQEHEAGEEQEAQEFAPEADLEFSDRDLEIFKRLDDDFHDLFAQSGDYYKQRTREEDKRKTYLDQLIKEESSLFETLMLQAKESFDPQDLPIAECLIGSFNSSGFLDESLEEIAEFEGFDVKDLQRVLTLIQDFDPPGVGARNLQESLLIQLRRQLKDQSLAYFIVQEHFDDLLHNRLPAISKKLSCTSVQIQDAIDRHIAKLDLHPGASFTKIVAETIVPDVTILQEDDALKAVVNSDYIPSIRVNSKYLKMLEDPSIPLEDKEFIRSKVLSAKWMMQNFLQRNSTLESIAELLIKWQKPFLSDPKGDLAPLQMKVFADELNLAESTIARAVANKYVATPRGVFPLRFFFTNAYQTDGGEEISQKTVQNLLFDLISKEDKQKPLSDDAISKLMREQGVPCARRTVAKLRGVLNIGNTRQRKQHS